MAQHPDVEYSDMQGLLRFGYTRLTSACFLLLRIDDVSAASRWLAQAPVSNAEMQDPPPSRSLQIAFTHQGLRKLDRTNDILNAFSAEFLSGMVGDDNRSSRLGDIGANSPELWQWGGYGSEPDLVVMIYATPDLFETWKSTLQSELSQSGFSLIAYLPTADLDGVEPFGFADGVSTPAIDWERRRDPSGDKLSYENMSMLGEFVLGYPNEYGKYTNRPLVANSSADLPDAEDSPGLKDLGRNGTYLVIRQIEQDVRGFWKFLDQQTNGDFARRQDLAEKLVGRRMSGDPLLPLTRTPINGVGPDSNDLNKNQFTFDTDPHGIACPFGAHIRRANPRNADLPLGTSSSLVDRLWHILALDRLNGSDIHKDLVASTRFHRLLRRGRKYGPQITATQRLEPTPPAEPPSGLNFICLNANIGRQFEFIQSAWIMNSKFNGLTGESDPLLGNREPMAGCPASSFSLPASEGLRQQLHNMPRFTTIRGGAYFFLPGLRALRYLAHAARV